MQHVAPTCAYVCNTPVQGITSAGSQCLALSRRPASPARPCSLLLLWLLSATALSPGSSISHRSPTRTGACVCPCAGLWRSLRSSVASSCPPMRSGGSNRPSTGAPSPTLLLGSQSTSRSGRWAMLELSAAHVCSGEETVCWPEWEPCWLRVSLLCMLAHQAAPTQCQPCAGLIADQHAAQDKPWLS